MMQGLLGIQWSLVKATYGQKIAERLVQGTSKVRCEVAKCVAYCASTCETQCESLDSQDESFLEEIGWVKDWCDVEASKAAIATQCKDIKEKEEGCDANCDSAE